MYLFDIFTRAPEWELVVRDIKVIYITEACQSTIIKRVKYSKDLCVKKLLLDTWIESWPTKHKTQCCSREVLEKEIERREDDSCIWWTLRDWNIQLPKLKGDRDEGSRIV